MTVSSKKTVGNRLDSLMVERNLAESRTKAQALVMAGEVRVDGEVVTRPGKLIDHNAAIEIAARMPYVSRGGLKLAHALDEFRLSVEGMTVIDAGASTGGFTDCLLQRGARRVYAIDVGFGQLDYRLRKDPRVVVMEKTNARNPFELPEPADLATMDLSFISVTKVLPNIAGHLRRPGRIIVLFKPQFEARREEVGKGGIIQDPLLHATILGRFIAWLAGQGIVLEGLTRSPVTGADGNQEFLLALKVERDIVT